MENIKNKKRVLNKAIKATLPALLLAQPGIASVRSSNISQRHIGGAQSVAVNESRNVSAPRRPQSPFGAFGESTTPRPGSKPDNGIDSALDFLKNNGFLKSSESRGASLSGDTVSNFGRKSFAGFPTSYCSSYETVYTTITACYDAGGTWINLNDHTAPSFENGTPSLRVSNLSSIQIDVEANEASTAYGVILEDGAAAPSILQVKNAQNGVGEDAIDSDGVALLAWDFSNFLTFSGLSPSTDYDAYIYMIDDNNNAQAFVTKLDVTTLGEPEINVQGQGLDIESGDYNPTISDGTNFQEVVVGNQKTNSFTIQNTGTADLTINSVAENCESFSVTQASSPIEPAGSVSFDVTYAPVSVSSTDDCAISINNDDSDEGTYSFFVVGVASDPVAPEINLQGQGIDIYSGDIIPSESDGTYFLDVAVGVEESHSFTIQNIGNGDLVVNGISTNCERFSVTQPTSPIAAAASVSFDVSYLPITATSFDDCTITIDNNDDNEAAYSFYVVGSGADVEAPSFENGTPSVSSVGESSVLINVDINEDGQVYVVAVNDNDGQPSVSQVITGLNSSGSAALASGNLYLGPSEYSGVLSISGLSAFSDYDLYLIAHDDQASPNVQASVTKLDVTTIGSPEINLLGQGQSIGSGDLIPSNDDGTYFLNVAIGDTETHSFTIQNTGTDDLVVNAVTEACESFSVTTVNETISPASSVDFDLSYAPLTYSSSEDCTVTITNNDGDEASYMFAVSGSAADVKSPSLEVVNVVPSPTADSTPAFTFSTDESGVLLVSGSCGSAQEGGVGVGNVTISLHQPDNTSALTDGLYNDCYVTVTDAFGNESDALQINAFTIDTTAPAAPTVSTPSVEISVESSTFIVSGTHVEDGVQIKLFSDANNDGQPDDTATYQETIVNQGAWTIPVSLNFDQQHHFVVIAEDSLGHVSGNVDVPGITYFVNSTPVIDQGESVDVSINEDSLPDAFSLTLSASDSNNDALTWSVSTQATNGSVSLGGVGNSRDISYVPAANFYGEDSFVIQVSDGESEDSILVSVTVLPVNDDPTGELSVTGNRVKGYTLTAVANLADEDGMGQLQYQWRRGSVNISGAVLNQYVLTSDDVGETLYVDVSYSDGNGYAEQVSSNALGPVIGDLDDDGIGDDVDPDIDGDGMDNTFESANGLDPLDADDAGGDLDSDGVSNLNEFLNMTNPASDDYGPVISLDSHAEINAEALVTPLPDDLVNAIDALDGPVSVSHDLASDALVPGRHHITWSAADAAGNTTSENQVLDILPLANWQLDQEASEGNEVTVNLYLNGDAPEYPVVAQYSIAGTAQNPDDHNAENGTISISEGRTASVSFQVVSDLVSEANETVTFTLDSLSYAATGAMDLHTVTISEFNHAPSVSLSASLDSLPGELLSIFAQSEGGATVRAVVTDIDEGNSHEFTWSLADGLNGIENGNEVYFDPSSVAPGVYQISVTATDDAVDQKSGAALMTITVLQEKPTLSSELDSDGDGISDHDEGFVDSDGDLVPDFLDDTEEENLLAMFPTGNEPDEGAWFVETSPGLSLTLNSYSSGTGEYSPLLNSEDVVDNSSADQSDLGFVYDGGIFDFVVSDISIPGDTIYVVLPQLSSIPENAVYRKEKDGEWADFFEDGNNSIHSSEGMLGVCPPPQSEQYSIGLTAGHNCVQLGIEDGGMNDADGQANGTVVDPGGVASEDVTPSKSSSGGGALSWPITSLLALLALVSLARKREWSQNLPPSLNIKQEQNN